MLAISSCLLLALSSTVLALPTVGKRHGELEEPSRTIQSSGLFSSLHRRGDPSLPGIPDFIDLKSCNVEQLQGRMPSGTLHDV